MNKRIVRINNSFDGFFEKTKKKEIFSFRFFFRSIELKDAFALFDRLGGGMISTKDLSFVMHSIGYQTTSTELEQMIREVDQDGLFSCKFSRSIICSCVNDLGNGMIDFNEFKQMMNRKGENHLEMFNDELLNEAFRIFDKDGNGLISETEIRSVMSNLGKIVKIEGKQ